MDIEKYSKEYYKNNKKHILSIQQLYRKNNLLFVKKNQRSWYIKTKKYILCTCGSKILLHNLKNHEKTLKHQGIKRTPKIKNPEPKISKNKITKIKPIQKTPIPTHYYFVSRNGIIKLS